MQIRNSSSLVQQPAKLFPNSYYKINKCLASYHMCFVSLTRQNFCCISCVRFIKIINVDKITNAFVKFFCRRCKRLLDLPCESKKSTPTVFANGWEFLINFLHTYYVIISIYTRLQIFIQLSPTLTKLCHTQRDHLANFYILLEL